MIHMEEGKKCVQWGINGCRHSVLTERCKRIVGHHFIFVLLAAVKVLELFQSIQVEQRESRILNRPEVPAASFNR